MLQFPFKARIHGFYDMTESDTAAAVDKNLSVPTDVPDKLDSAAKNREGVEDLDSEQDFFAKARERERLRKKRRSKKLKYDFLFKSGAFLVMLTVVLITKQVQKYLGHDAHGGANATLSSDKGEL